MAEESKLQTKILNDLRSLGKYCEVFKIIKTSDNGIPDIYFTTALTEGFFIEVKEPGGKPRKLQEVKIRRLKACGSNVIVCDTWEGWYDIKRHIGLLDMDAIKREHEKQEQLLS